MRFAVQVVVVRAVTGVRYGILRIEAVQIMKLLHQRHEAIHIGAVVVDVCHGDILIRHADLYVVCRQQLLAPAPWVLL